MLFPAQRPAAIQNANELGAAAAVAALRTGHIDAEALVEDCLARIAEREPLVGAWEALDPAAALAAARRARRGAARGPLHGIPIAIKDIIDTADLPTDYGSPIYAGHRPAADAACVAALRDAGAHRDGQDGDDRVRVFPPGKTAQPA